MFFSTYVLTKKGPLAKVWLAAHWDKKLTKTEVKVIDLKDTVLQIVKPAVPIALRTSGELMLGVVRIYVLKVKHVQKDATDATTTLLRGTQKNQSGLPLGKAGPHKAIDMPSAVTHLDVVVNRAGLEALCEADFSSIADIMLPGGDGLKKAAGQADGTWFADPVSQLEGIHPQSQEDIFKELAAFDKTMQQQRGASDSKSKSTTGSSVEGPRGGNAAHANILDPAIGILGDDDLNLQGLTAPGGAAGQPDDIFDAQIEEIPAATAGGEEAIKRRLKVVNILDTKDTTLSSAQLDKNKSSRSDTLCAERRHGPLDEDDAAARFILRHADTSVVDCAPLGNLAPNSGLRAVFERAMKETVETAVEAAEAARGGPSAGRKTNGRDSLKAGVEGGVGADDMPQPLDHDIFDPYQAEPLPSPEEVKSKRGKRDRDDAKAPQFSASALATLGNLQGVLKGKTESCTLSSINKNKKKTEAARTFVDILVLASHGRIAVDQRTSHGEIVLHKTDKLAEAVASN